MEQKKKEMKYVLSRQFSFEAAHRLLKNYSGKCSNNHGHSWTITLYIESCKLDQKDMVIDFSEMKKLKKWINDNLDHATILWKDDPMLDYLRQNGHKVYAAMKNPTSEHIGTILLKTAIDIFSSDKITVQSVEVNETCTSKCRVYNEAVSSDLMIND